MEKKNRKRAKVVNYLLRAIPADTWHLFKTQLAYEGMSIRGFFQKAINNFLKGKEERK